MAVICLEIYLSINSFWKSSKIILSVWKQSVGMCKYECCCMVSLISLGVSNRWLVRSLFFYQMIPSWITDYCRTLRVIMTTFSPHIFQWLKVWTLLQDSFAHSFLRPGYLICGHPSARIFLRYTVHSGTPDLFIRLFILRSQYSPISISQW